MYSGFVWYGGQCPQLPDSDKNINRLTALESLNQELTEPGEGFGNVLKLRGSRGTTKR